MNYNELSKDYDFWLADWSTIKPNRNIYGNYGMWQFGGSENYLRTDKIDDKVCDQDYSFKDYPKIMSSNNLNSFNNKEISISNNKSSKHENTNKDAPNKNSSNNTFEKELKSTIENEIEDEIKYELVENKTKIFKLIWKWFKKLIGYIIFTFKK